MANRYWVGGTANWDGTAGTKWALTSGGAGGQAVPTSADDVFFDANSGSGTITTAASNSCKSLTCTGFVGTLNNSASSFGDITVYGNLTLVSGMTYSGNGQITFAGTGTCVTAGKTIQLFSVNGAGITVTLGDALIVSGAFTLVAGTFNASTYNVTAGTCSISGSSTRTLSMGSGTWTLTSSGSVWNATTKTNLTFNKDTANIVLSNTTTSSRTFAGSSLTYNKLTIGGTTGTSTLTFTGSNTFSEIASTKTVAHTMTFNAGTTTTVGAWSVSGTSGNVVTLGSTTTSAFTLTKTGGGTVSADYMSISYSTATPSNTWYAGANSTNGGNNSGWLFTAAPSTSSINFFSILKRRV